VLLSETMKYVSEQVNIMARRMEAKIQKLPPEAGVMFVGVCPEPMNNGQSTNFIIYLGISRDFETSIGRSLAEHVLREEMTSGAKVLVFAYRGVAGACRVSHHEATDPPASEA
jgi:hypothetical protein